MQRTLSFHPKFIKQYSCHSFSSQFSCLTFQTLAQHDQRVFCPPILEFTLRLKLLKQSDQDLQNSFLFPVKKYVCFHIPPPKIRLSFI